MKASEIKPGDRIFCFTVESFSHKDSRHRKWWNAVCECGVRKVIHGSAVVSGNTKSCGCYGKKVRMSKRISNIHSDVTAIILGYKRHAERRGFAWNLDRSDVEGIIFKNCSYCDAAPSNIKKTKNSIGSGLKYSGIDRIDSKGSYDIENCLPCCKVCNYAKSDMSIEEFKVWAIRIGKEAMAAQWGGDIKHK